MADIHSTPTHREAAAAGVLAFIAADLDALRRAAAACIDMQGEEQAAALVAVAALAAGTGLRTDRAAHALGGPRLQADEFWLTGGTKEAEQLQALAA